MSKIDIGLKNPFRFYSERRFQERRQSWSKYALDAFKLICPDDRLLPFQVVKSEASPFLFTSFKIYDWKTGNVVLSTNDIHTLIDENDLSVYTFADVEYIVYFGNLGFVNGYSLPEGQYYIETQSGTENWTSEIFTVYKNVINAVRSIHFLPPSSTNDDYTDIIRKYRIDGRMDWGASGRLELKFNNETFYFRTFSQDPALDFENIYDWISFDLQFNVDGIPNNDQITIEVAGYELQSVKYIYDGSTSDIVFPVTYLSQRQDPNFWYQMDGQSELFVNTLDCFVEIDGVLRAKQENDFNTYRSYSGSISVIKSGSSTNHDITSFPKEIFLTVADDYFAFGTDNGEVVRIKKFAEARVDSNGCYALIEYCNCAPLGRILYGNDYQYKNRIYLDMEIGEPEYKTEEEGFEDGNKIFHPTFQSQKKIYKIELVLPEFMVDAVNLLTLHDVVYLKLPYKEDARIKDIKVGTKWEGAFAEVEIEFREEVIVRSGSCNSDQLKSYREAYAKDVLCSIVLNDYEYSTGKYTKDFSNIYTLFETDDLVLIFDDATQTTGAVYRVERDGPNVTYNFESAYQVETTLIYSIRENKYRIFVGVPYGVWSDIPFIKEKNLTGVALGSIIQYNVKGVIFPNTYSELYYANVYPVLPGSTPIPLNFVKANNAPLVQEEVLNDGFNSPFVGIRMFKISSKNHSLDFGLSEYK